MAKETPVYVRIEEFRDVLDIVNMIKSKLSLARETMDKFNELRDQEDIEMQKWQRAFESTEARVQQIDRTLFEPQA